MTADGAADDAVRTGQNVDVEVRVDFQSGQNDEVQLVDSRLSSVTRVRRSVDLLMEVILLQGLGCVEVEGLDVQDLLDQAFFVHGRDLAGDAAQREPALDALVDHHLTQVSGRRQGRAAGTHLHGESVVDVAGSLDDFRRGLRDDQFLRVLRVAGCAAHDALRVADVVHDHHVIHVGFGDGAGRVRELHEVIRDDDGRIRHAGVRTGVAQGAAHDGLVVISAVAVGVAERVAGRSAQESHVDVQLAGSDRFASAAVGAEDDGEIHQAAGDLFRQFSAHAGRFDVGDDALLDVLDQRRMYGSQGAGCQGQILEAHLRQLGDDLVDDVVAVAEMMVEADGVAVL